MNLGATQLGVPKLSVPKLGTPDTVTSPPRRGGIPHLSVRVPWGPLLGLARTLVAAATAGTLFASPPDVLYGQLLSGTPEAHTASCSGIHSVSALCLVSPGLIPAIHYGCAVILLVVMTGWQPRITALPHLYVTASVVWSCQLPDGGDQLSVILCLLLLPVLLGDSRRWHWEYPHGENISARGSVPVLIAVTGLHLIRVQVSLVYLTAGIAKLAVPTWVDGTEIYYWIRHPVFGAAAPWDLIGQWATAIPLITLIASWGTLLTEGALGISMVLPSAFRCRVLLPCGIVLHLAIAIFLGITSFSVVMIAALILLLTPPGAGLRELNPILKR